MLDLSCPHCRNPIELGDPATPEEILCSACGSSFRLEPGATLMKPPGAAQSRLGRFVVLETLGQGTFGTVYKARDSQLDRVVAVKVPRAGNLAGQGDLDRFLREARSVAQLRHPGIVSVHEVGQLDGLPYLVSDFVPGITLADRLSSARPTVRESARLVAQVAEALHYAHEQGVIHRDVKPSNIMLGDNRTAYVMDFGLAKRDAGETTMTLDGQLLGTPAYMSPEQARGQAHRVDGRSDIYSLGVILYELLTGELPFRGNTRMLLHQVLHEEPRSPRRLNDRIPRDLETICLKAMAKEPGQRYQTAGALAEDLHRFLNGEPIQARPVGKVQRLWRWCRRKPALAGTLGTLLVVIIGGLAGLTILYLNAERQRLMAERREGEARAIARFYEDHVLAAARPKGWEGGVGKDVSLRQALDQAAPSIGEAFAGQPELEAAVRNTLGMTYYYLGRFEAANPQLETAYTMRLERLGPDHPDTLTSLHNLAYLRWKQGQFKEAVALGRQALEGRRRVLGPEHEDTLSSQLNLGLFLDEDNQLDEAEALLRAAIESCKRTLGADHRYCFYGQNDLAWVLGDQGKLEGALALHREVLDGRRRTLGLDHPETLRSMQNVAFFLDLLGRFAEAEPLYRQSLATKYRVLGPDHFETLWTESNLGNLLSERGNYPEAEKLLRRCLGVQRKTLGPGHFYLSHTLVYLGSMLTADRRPDEGEPLLRESLAIREKVLPRGHWQISQARSFLGGSLGLQSKFTEAEPLLLAGYEGLTQAQGAPARQVARALDRVIELYEQWGKPDQANVWKKKRPPSAN
jgi:tetratricopeptide (TPR) repeat protein/tRNA A-37 threonylcarbamoyl transferase component Bud32